MTQQNPLLALHTEVQRSIEWWNTKRFGGKLPPVMVGFYPQTPRGRRLGHYLPECWVKGAHKSAEIVLYADLCLASGPKEVLLTVAHELVHHWQHIHGKPGRPPRHTREWHEKAQAIGLVTEGPKGYTTPGPVFEADAKEFGFKLDAIVFRSVPLRARQKGKMRKWTCSQDCNGSIRSGKSEIYVRCNVCLEDLRPADEIENEE